MAPTTRASATTLTALSPSPLATLRYAGRPSPAPAVSVEQDGDETEDQYAPIVEAYRSRRGRHHNNSAVQATAAQQPVIRFSTDFRNTIYEVCLARGYQHVADPQSIDWELQWCSKGWVRNVLCHIHLPAHQTVNHFRSYSQLCRKDTLAMNVKRKRRQLQRQITALQQQLKQSATPSAALQQELRALEVDLSGYRYIPETYEFPYEYQMFVTAYKQANLDAAAGGGSAVAWIIKPVAGSQGKGIAIHTQLKQIQTYVWSSSAAPTSQASTMYSAAQQQRRPAQAPGRVGKQTSEVDSAGEQAAATATEPQRYVVQRYIGDPLLIGGKKFDLRLYVLVLSYHPLHVYLHRGGFARFASQPYRVMAPDDDEDDESAVHGSTGARVTAGYHSNTNAHLTNVHLQKHSATYDEESGGKWSLDSMCRHLHATYGRTGLQACMLQIEQLIIRSLRAVQPVMSTTSSAAAALTDGTSIGAGEGRMFELYGYDILLDSQLRAWLLEVNASPSLSASTPADRTFKHALLHDTLDIAMNSQLRGYIQQQHTLQMQQASNPKSGRRKPHTAAARQQSVAPTMSSRAPTSLALGSDIDDEPAVGPAKHATANPVPAHGGFDCVVDCDAAAYEAGAAADSYAQSRHGSAPTAQHGLSSQQYASKLGCANAREKTLQQVRRRQAAQSSAAVAD